MFKRFSLIIVTLIILTNILSAQRYEFKEALIRYSFEDSTFNYKLIVEGKLGLFDSEKGVLVFGIPLQYVTTVSDSLGMVHNLNSNIMLNHQGLFWGDYDMNSNGKYKGDTRGLLGVQGNKVTRGFASQTLISVEEELDFIETKLTFKLESVPSLEVFGNESSFLNEEIEISVTITKFSESN